MDIVANLTIGLQTAFAFDNLFYCFLGVFLGTLIGVIPGIGSLAAISLLFPISFHLEPTTALIMLAGIWYGTSFGGNTASILLNIPGTTSSAVTCLDGYPMTRQGRGGIALFMTTVGSFIGGTFGIILLMLASPAIAGFALRFGSAEYFALMLMGLVASSTISDGSALKGLAMVALGIAFGVVGTDIYTGVPRFTFGTLSLLDGISLVALAMGLFGVAEVMKSVGKIDVRSVDRKSVSLRSMIPTGDDVRRSIMPIVRGTGIGAFFGTLPGVGPSIAAFVSYAMEKRVAKEPSRFGKGAVEGVMAPESANNAADMTAFIPTLSLGIPGSATMAIMLGVLMIHGITPGPSLMSDHPSIFWGLIMSFWIGNVLLVILNIPMIGLWVRLLLVPYNLLYPAILTFVCIGAYSVNRMAADVWMVLFFSALGFFMRYFSLPPAPLLLGFVLGPLMEEHFRRAMLLSRGDPMTFLERPISATVMTVTTLLLVWALWSTFTDRRTSHQSARRLSAANIRGDVRND